MTECPENIESCTLQKIHDNPRNSVIIIFLSTLLLYIITANFSYLYHHVRVPTGDPFTYTISYFQVIDSSSENYFRSLIQVITSNNFYWLEHLLIAIISPILVKEPYSIALINYLLFFLATISLYKLLKCLKIDEKSAIILSFTLWLYPWFYGVKESNIFSLLVLQLDSTFFVMLFILTFTLVIFSLQPEKINYAIIAGFCTGLALWGRGSSVTHVFMILIMPIIYIIVKVFIKANRRKIIFNIILFFFISTFLASWYYYFASSSILLYYLEGPLYVPLKTDLISKVSLIINSCPFYLTNIPGILFTNKPDSFLTKFITCFISLVIVITFYIFLVKKHQNAPFIKSFKPVVVIALVIYYESYIAGLIILSMFTNLGGGITFAISDPSIYKHNAPILIGVIILNICIAYYIIFRYKLSSLINKIPIIIVIIILLSYSFFITKWRTPLTELPETVKPVEMEEFALNLEKITGNETIAILWYHTYNPPILYYYRLKHNRPYFNWFQKYDKYIFVCRPTPLKEFRLALRKTLEEADWIIIPENPESYKYLYPSLLQLHGATELIALMKEPTRPKFIVKMILHDATGIRLLLLKRLKEGETAEGFEYLPFSYGKIHTYVKALSDQIDTHQKSTKLQPSFPPTNLFDESTSEGSFWEVNDLFQHCVKIEMLEEELMMTRYTLCTGPSGNDRMPSKWKIKASVDGQKWVEIDSRINEINWKVDEKREYNVSSPSMYKYYLFIFEEGNSKNIIRMYEIEMYTQEKGKYIKLSPSSLYVKVTDEREMVKTKVSEIEKIKVSEMPKLVKEGYKGFNFVLYRGKYYVISQSLGEIDLIKIKEDTLVEYKKLNKCFITNSLEEAKYIVDKNLY